jgi:hypothetical protein
LAEIVINLSHAHYGTENKVIFISNRINSYSVKPTDWIKITNKFNNLIGVGVVNYTAFSKSIFAIEKLFSKKQFIGFENLSAALEWAEELVENEKNLVLINKDQTK